MNAQPTGILAAALENQPQSANSAPATKNIKSDFARHAVVHTVANLGTLACSGAFAFILPRFLSVDDYGYYRLFLLYGSFAGILHLGFLDGLLVRWAARPLPRLRNELSGSLVFLTLEQIALLA